MFNYVRLFKHTTLIVSTPCSLKDFETKSWAQSRAIQHQVTTVETGVEILATFFQDLIEVELVN